MASLRYWKQYNEWKDKRNKARAELEAKYGYDCYLDDTEFLTERGWLRYDEVGEGDRLGTINKSTGEVEYQGFLDRVEKSFSGHLGVLHPRHSNCAVTLNHRMLVSPARRSQANGFSWSYSTESADWGLQKLEDLLKGGQSYFHVRLAGEPSNRDYPVDDGYLQLMGAYVSEGCVGKRLQDGTASVLRISQKKGGRMESLMNGLQQTNPFEASSIRRFEYLHDEPHRSEPCLEVVWTIADRELAPRLESECGDGSLNKRLPSWTRSLSRRQATLLLGCLVLGDGTKRDFSDVYYTTSRRLADDIQAMCVHAGVVSQVWGPYAQELSDNPMFQVYIGKGKPFASVVLRSGGSQNLTIEKVSKVRVVCFTVPNEVLVTRRHGKVAIQGNSKHAMHLVRLLRMCREILTEGLVRVRRPDAKDLLAIRNGAWPYDKLIAWADEQDVELVELAKGSDLPKKPDRNRLNELCLEITDMVDHACA